MDAFESMELSTDPVWVGVDLGTQSVRVVALADDGSQLALASRPVHSLRSVGVHEQDPEEWWAAARDALREVTTALGNRAHVTALAISATSGTIVLLDESGHPVSAGIMYDDARGAAHSDRVNKVGHHVWSRLGYRMQGSWALPTIVELRRRGELGAGRTVATQADFIASKLLGRSVPSDSSHALKSGVDLDSLSWPADVMTALDIPLDRLPAVVASGTVLGTVSSDAWDQTGLHPSCVVVAGMTDGCSAQLAAGALTPGSWNSVLGTTLVVKGMSRERKADPTGAVYSHRAPFGAGWFPGGASSTGAGAMTQWLAGRDLAALTRVVEAAAVGARSGSGSAPVSYPLVGRGERFPFVAPEAEAFFETTGRMDDASTFSAIAHGVAFVERLSYDLLGLCGYDTSGELGFTGGGSRNPWWNQLRCDILRRPVRIPQSGEGAIGMAVLAAAALDDTGQADTRLTVAAGRLLPPAEILQPDSTVADNLMAGYRSFLETLSRRGWIDSELYAHAIGASDTREPL